jgi:hypothetical protein
MIDEEIARDVAGQRTKGVYIADGSSDPVSAEEHTSVCIVVRYDCDVPGVRIERRYVLTTAVLIALPCRENTCAVHSIQIEIHPQEIRPLHVVDIARMLGDEEISTRGGVEYQRPRV